eukprot:5509787-Pleurochrysis_carterae.AAC.2
METGIPIWEELDNSIWGSIAIGHDCVELVQVERGAPMKTELTLYCRSNFLHITYNVRNITLSGLR